ncbi:DUF4330 domain-containing protein [Altericista sp. CCNU0014]|uniref:DUF4330 domain-containing protein n=1 Tax=Altericista sp. CCNU0014 TaxID=3082949 RepID=UPI00384CEA9D
MTSLNRRSGPAQWMNLGAIAVLAIAFIYLFFWPGPEGLPLVKIGLPQRAVVLEANIAGLNTTDIESTLRPGTEVKVSIKNSALIPLTLKSIERVPGTVVATQPNGNVAPQPDPRPEMRFGSNLLLKLEGKGYSNQSGFFLGVKRIRVGSTVVIDSAGVETPASVVGVVVEPLSKS